MYGIKILLNLGDGWPRFKEDDEVVVPDDCPAAVAERLIRSGLAVKCQLPPERVQIEQKPVVQQAAAPVQQTPKLRPRRAAGVKKHGSSPTG